MGTIRWGPVERFRERKAAPDMLVHCRGVSRAAWRGVFREGGPGEGGAEKCTRAAVYPTPGQDGVAPTARPQAL